MNTMRITLLGLVMICSARADFSYNQTRKGGPAGAGNAENKVYYKGQKMATIGSTISTVLDFDAQTVTLINHAQKNYVVTRFSELGQGLKDTKVDAQVDVKQTGQKKNINGFNATEVLMTIAIDAPSQAGMKMTMEVSTWLSPDVPGSQELRAFYQKNMERFPWAAMAGGAASGMQKAMVDAQKEIAKLGGVTVMQVMRMKSAGSDAQNQQMQQAMAQMEAMRKQGGRGGAGGAMFEITTECTGFSTASIADSVFAVPAGYAKK